VTLATSTKPVPGLAVIEDCMNELIKYIFHHDEKLPEPVEL